MYAFTDRPALLHQPTLSKTIKELKKKSVKNTRNNRYTSCYMKNTEKNT